MKIKLILSLIAFSFALQSGFAQIQDYTYKRKLDASTDMWHRIQIPPEMYGKFLYDFSDVRIFGIAKNGDTIQAPYIVVSNSRKISETPLAFDLINKSYKNDTYYYTLSLKSLKIANRIHLDFENSNYEYRIDLEGSNDNAEWFGILKDYRILSIKNKLTDYTFSDVNFDDSHYNYYRIAIHSAKDPKLKQAEISIKTEESGEYNHEEIITFKDSSIDKQTVLYFNSSNNTPISHYSISVSDTIDYYRYFTLEVLNNPEEKNKKLLQFTLISEGYLSSLNDNHFVVNTQHLGQHYRLTIKNNDNEPLNVTKLDLYDLRQTLVVRFTQPADYYLVYGNSKAAPPVYDLSYFKDKLPETSSFLGLGNQEVIANASTADEIKPLFSSKLWLWSIMLAIIGLLAWFSLKMIKNSSKSME